MIKYHFELAARSLRRPLWLGVFAIISVAIGIAACASLIAIQVSLSADPIPSKSARLFHVQIDTRMGEARQGEPLSGLNFSDATELGKLPLGAVRTTVTFGSYMLVGSAGHPPESIGVRATTSDFFPMFGVPLKEGRSWSASEEVSRANVAVISADLNKQLFGGTGLGKDIRVGKGLFRVIGVYGPWRPGPKYFDVTSGSFARTESVFVPLSAAVAMAAVPANMMCWGDPGPAEALERSPCGWLQAWVELRSPADGEIFQQRIANQLRDIGLDEPESRVRVVPLMAWLGEVGVIPDEVKLLTIIAFSFLVMSTAGVSGTMLLKYSERAREIAVRRALGASIKNIAAHIYSEALLISTGGVVLGIALAYGVLELVRRQDGSYATLVTMNSTTIYAVSLIGLLISIAGCTVTLARIAHSTPTQLMGRWS